MTKLPTEKLKEICRHHDVQSLSLFGSVTSNSFTDDSDIDVLISFDESDTINYFDCYFALKQELETYWNRPVDLVVEKEFRNKFFRDSVEASRQVLYER